MMKSAASPSAGHGENAGVIAETERLVIRRLTAADRDAIARVLCDSKVMEFSMGRLPRNQVSQWIHDRTAEYEQLGYGIWAVTLSTSGETIGYCGFSRLGGDDGGQDTEIGFRLARRFWSRGYATEAASATLSYGFSVLGLPRIVALVDPYNTRSIRVVEKLGMQWERDIMLPGYDHPDRLYVARRTARSTALPSHSPPAY